MSDSKNYSRLSPFIAKIKHRQDLCYSCPDKITQHIVLDLMDSGIEYNVGDCVGVYPVNDPELVLLTLKAMKAEGNENIVDPETSEAYSLRQYLSIKKNVSDVSKNLLKEMAHRQSNADKRIELETLLKKENSALLKEYLHGKHLWDILLHHDEVYFTPQELCPYLMPLLPRYYSIASSQKMMKNEIHLTVRLLSYEAHGHPRIGVCTHYLCNLTPTEEPIVPLFIHPHSGFTIPEDNSANMIMVGPGTGVAPFRAFMQEREILGASGKNWLFFGEWRKDRNFLYKDYWHRLVDEGKLRLDVAFSRDQEDKIYVQHLLLDHGKEIFQWIEEGAYFYVCGDAKKMAKDVENALIEIIKKEGNLSEESAKDYVKQLRKEKRYLRDVY